MSIFSRRRKLAASTAPETVTARVRPAPEPVRRPQPVEHVPSRNTLRVSAEFTDEEGNRIVRRTAREYISMPRQMTPVIAGVDSLDGYTKIRWHDNRFFIQTGENPMQPNTEWVVRHCGTFDSETEAVAAMEAALDEYIVVDGYRWIQIHEPAITVGPDGVIVDLVPAHRELPVRIPLHVYSLEELSMARVVAKALPEPATAGPEIRITDSFYMAGFYELSPAGFRARREKEARTRRPEQAPVQALAELMAKLPPHTMREAAQLLLKAADAAER